MVTVADRSRSRSARRSESRRSVFWPAVAALAASKVVFQLATADLYGAHRDEFYYLESGYHLAFGYVDNPPLVPWIYRVEQAAFGHSVISLAVVPAVLGGVFVVIGAMIAAELGGRYTAQVLTGVVAWLGPLFLTTSHFLGTVSLDLVVWAVASWMVIRMVRNSDTRWWVPVGAVVGIGLLNKDTVLFWAVGAGVGLLLSPQRRLLWSPWLPAGIAIAVCVALPNLVWQATHHWATLVFLRDLRADNASTDLAEFAPLQLLLVTIGGTILWIVALVTLLRHPAWRSQVWLAYGYGVIFCLIFALGGKAYYLGSWYLPLVAVGAVVVERSWSKRAIGVLFVVTLVTGLAFAPVATPIVPERAAVAAHLDTRNKDLGAMLGWPHVVRQIAAAVDSLPPASRAHAIVFSGNYSEAGAVDFYGPALGLPSAISGHNTFWLWGYGHPAPGATVVAVGLPSSFVHRYWSSVVLASTLGRGGPPVDPHERGSPIWICRHQRLPWAAIWPAARHYD